MFCHMGRNPPIISNIRIIDASHLDERRAESSIEPLDRSQTVPLIQSNVQKCKDTTGKETKLFIDFHGVWDIMPEKPWTFKVKHFKTKKSISLALKNLSIRASIR